MSRARQRADRIKAEIPIAQVLADYGYTVHAEYGGEEQFPCDLHGDGHDNKPSARVYPDSNSWYCFACDRTRDSIQTVREKEGLDFWAAVKALEQRYRLTPLEYEDDGEAAAQPAKKGVVQAIQTELAPDKTFEDDRLRTWKFLDGLTVDRELPLTALVKLWEAYDKTCHLVESGLPEKKGREALAKIREKAVEKTKGAQS